MQEGERTSWFDRRSGLAGSVAVVVGGAGGLGRASVEDLVANGVRPAVLDIDASAARELAAAFDAGGVEAVVHTGDARDPDELARLFAAVDERWGRTDVLVNVAGGTFHADFADSSPRGWEALIRMNLMPVLHACALAVPRMKAGGRGGSIINLSTVEAHRAAPGYAVYSGTKAAVEQFARSLALEVAPDGIRVNNIAPDYVPTPNVVRHIGEANLHGPTALGVSVPMGRAGRPEEVSGCVVFLASQLSSYMTGTTLHPDGGTLASSGWFNWPDAGWRNFLPAPVAGLLDGVDPGAPGTS
ncbi:SDR family NAD(P)-dependent oxidoreductase [Trujillonella endophytica]|uniref:NAD(P)-dependent dehydrogenase, short-chain alcohol dehydrogenase family n=1 Tax=Trujillonella endophytica TaxID=673521 RepID=A0A1H8SGF3_9ACTN|nr:SDR family oxidoreductase [Trujillella endophytica]SEO77655.1 NAD(P)-dependent dehydrogenase, short-chain alcohol dehydrogenase family [Trujillella endophytica]